MASCNCSGDGGTPMPAMTATFVNPNVEKATMPLFDEIRELRARADGADVRFLESDVRAEKFAQYMDDRIGQLSDRISRIERVIGL